MIMKALALVLLVTPAFTAAFVPSTIVAPCLPSTTATKLGYKNDKNKQATQTSDETIMETKSAKDERIEHEKQSLLDDHVNVVSRDKKFGLPYFVDGKSAVPTGKVIDKLRDDEALQKRLERVLQPRAYPILALERAAQLAEDTVGNIFKKKGKDGAHKERIVVLGSGWGAASFLQHIDTDRYDVTVVSPRNYFLFTPMLTGSSVGTCEYRSITMPIRSINPNIKYLEAAATDVDPVSRTISCISIECDELCEVRDLQVEYDRLVVAVGAQISTFGVPGVSEHCYFLKEVEDAKRIRKAIVSAFEKASLPDISEQEKQDALTFCVVGAGPTGVEFAAELRDFVEEDGPKYYPNLLKYVRIKIFEYGPGILGPFDATLQDAAAAQLTRETTNQWLPNHSHLIELYLSKGVSEVRENEIILSNGESVKSAMCVWAAGNGPRPITLQVITALGQEQAATQTAARGRIAVDPWLRALGGNGEIFALGDNACGSCNTQNRQLPATAQVAGQQAEHLARLFSSGFDMDAKSDKDVLLPPTRKVLADMQLWERIASMSLGDKEIAAPFQFLDMGILAYTGGGSALAQVQICDKDKVSPAKLKGKLGFGVWQSVYLMKQPSWKNRILLTLDWAKSKMFGRDISKL